jgi:hypothetical protein
MRQLSIEMMDSTFSDGGDLSFSRAVPPRWFLGFCNHWDRIAREFLRISL